MYGKHFTHHFEGLNMTFMIHILHLKEEEVGEIEQYMGKDSSYLEDFSQNFDQFTFDYAPILSYSLQPQAVNNFTGQFFKFEGSLLTIDSTDLDFGLNLV